MVVKKIGSLLVMFLCAHSLYGDDIQIKLRILDSTSTQVTEAVINSSLLLEVVVEGTAQPIQRIAVDNLDRFHAQYRGVSSQTNRINGTATCKQTMSYALRPDNVGSFIIGPAYVTIDGREYYSDSMTLTVIETPRNNKQEAVFVTLEAEKDEVMVGEKIPFSMRVYYKGKSQINAVEPPNFSGVKDVLLEGPYNSQEAKNGVVYNYSEWKATLIPVGVGELKIPAARAFFFVPDQRQQSFFGGLVGIFDFNRSQEVAYSNTITVKVNPLPSHEGDLDAIGEFSDYFLEGNVDEISVGHAIVVFVSLSSPDRFDAKVVPKLQFPEDSTYYTSKSSENFSEGTQLYTKTFEYIVQSQREGEMVIRAEPFTFWDTKFKKYVTLSADSLRIMVVPGAQAQSEDQSGSEVVSTEQAVQQGAAEISWFGNATGGSFQDRSLPWRLVIIFSLIPLLAFLCLGVIRLIKGYFERHAEYYAQKNAYKKALKHLDTIKQSGKIEELYGLFQTYAKDRFGGTLTTILIKGRDKESWESFTTQLQEVAYYGKNPELNVKALMDLSTMWLSYLERRS
jgi:hypothetical protein